MYCSQCGLALALNARFCSKCGHPVDCGTLNALEPKPQDTAIWNPNAAANWSLLFTPAFGSLLQAINWRVLGEEGKFKAMMGWFYVSIALLIVYLSMGLLIREEKAADAAARGLAFIFIIVWYFAAARSQAKYVKAKFGASYARRSWGKPILIAIFAVAAYLTFSLVVGVLAGVSSNTRTDTKPDFSKFGTPTRPGPFDDLPNVRESKTATDARAKNKAHIENPNCISNAFSDLIPECLERYRLSRDEYSKRKARADVECRAGGNYVWEDCWDAVLSGKK